MWFEYYPGDIVNDFYQGIIGRATIAETAIKSGLLRKTSDTEKCFVLKRARRGSRSKAKPVNSYGGVMSRRCTVFEGPRRVASGALADVALTAKQMIDRDGPTGLLIFDDETSELVELDLRGSAEDVLGRLPAEETQAPAGPRGPGRPKLGVIGREVTLLPRHWEWLNDQPGGPSVALRKLVDEARKANEGPDRLRKAKESAYRFLSAMAGNLPGFEEVTRALFAGQADRFETLTEPWPVDVRDHARNVAAKAFE